MNLDKHTTEVMFRVDTTKGFKGNIIAILPHELNDHKGHVVVYQHVGQHSGADYYWMLKTSKLANESEYVDLKQELETIGYNIKVVKKRNYNKYLKAYYEVCK